jgi:hypothetical protein
VLLPLLRLPPLSCFLPPLLGRSCNKMPSFAAFSVLLSIILL